MVKITKQEAKYLHEKCGIKYGENGISVPPACHRAYLCENIYNMNKLNNYRNRGKVNGGRI